MLDYGKHPGIIKTKLKKQSEPGENLEVGEKSLLLKVEKSSGS